VYEKSAAFYDAIYSFKDYRSESARVRSLLHQSGCSDGASLLDVACGTGGHLAFLREHFAVQGLDLDQQMLDVARSRMPDVPLHRGDMTSFDIGIRFDAVICLFSSIGYTKTVDGLGLAIGAMSRQVRPGGVLIVEPWFSLDTFFPGHLNALFVDRPDLKIARMSVSAVENRVSVLAFSYLIGTAAGVSYETERHELGLFTRDEYLAAFRSCDLEVEYLTDGISERDNRGLFLGLAPMKRPR
jgi:SAM-dependent methyltransferase